MNSLKMLERGLRQAIKERVAIVKLGRDKSICKKNSRLKVEGWTNLTKLTNG